MNWSPSDWKKYFLSWSLHLFTFNFHSWPLSAWPPPLSNSKKSSIFSESKPFTIRKTWIKSPLTLLFSNDVILSNFNTLFYARNFRWPTFISPESSTAEWVGIRVQEPAGHADRAATENIPRCDGTEWRVVFRSRCSAESYNALQQYQSLLTTSSWLWETKECCWSTSIRSLLYYCPPAKRYSTELWSCP